MTEKLAPAGDREVTGEFNLILGAGGSRAVLGSTGTILACRVAGIERWRTIGGVSGGSIPAAMLASGVQPAEIARHIIETDFNSMLTPKTNLLSVWWAFFVKECSWKRRPFDGVLTSDRIGAFAETFSKTWPAAYWTMAMTGDTPVLFKHDGIFDCLEGGITRRRSSRPAPFGLAIRASCAVPGVVQGVEIEGDPYLDGGLARQGRLPVWLLKEHLGALPGTIIGCDVGEDGPEARDREHWFWKTLRRLVCGPCCDLNENDPVDGDGVILVQPPVPEVRSLELKLSPDQKWEALMSGFVAAIEALRKAGLLTGERLEEAEHIAQVFAAIQQRASQPGVLAEKARAHLVSHELFPAD